VNYVPIYFKTANIVPNLVPILMSKMAIVVHNAKLVIINKAGLVILVTTLTLLNVQVMKIKSNVKKDIY
jgi:hypothetical protein